jgi:ferrous iron transport protein B
MHGCHSSDKNCNRKAGRKAGGKPISLGDIQGNERLVLTGNPNVGKSVFFNSLTGMYVDVSNFPGTTVDISRGVYGRYIVEDTPGVYGVSSFNDEEIAARDIILNGDVILNVVDAAHLHRDLFLTQQLLDMGKKVLVAMNMMDEAGKNGVKIDIDKLSGLLGVPVVATMAVKNKGLEDVKEQLENARTGNRLQGIEELLKPYVAKGMSEADALMILEDDKEVSRRHNTEQAGLQEELYKRRRARVDEIVAETATESNEGAGFGIKLGRLMLKPLTGIPMLVVTLLAVFLFVGVFMGQTVVGITEGKIMGGLYQPFITGLLGPVIPVNSFLGQIFTGEFGLLTMTPVYVLGLLLPLVIGFYLMLSFLEDSGYLPRIAALSDRMMTGVGLNGRAIIPTILAFGCFTAATMTTRLLGSKRERVIATALLGLTIPCSAQMGVIAGRLASMGLLYTLFYIFTLVLLFGLAGKVLNKLLPGESSSLLIDLPPIRMPVFGNVLKKTLVKTKMFLWEATPLFALGALFISIMQYTGVLVAIQNAITPLTVWWLRLPKETATVFIMGMVRRDFGAAGLSNLVLTNQQLMTALITITLFVPCIAAVMVIFKERTKREAILIWSGSMLTAFIVGGLVSRLLSLF